MSDHRSYNCQVLPFFAVLIHVNGNLDLRSIVVDVATSDQLDAMAQAEFIAKRNWPDYDWKAVRAQAKGDIYIPNVSKYS